MNLNSLYEIARDLILEVDYYVKYFVNDLDDLAIFVTVLSAQVLNVRTNITQTFNPEGTFIVTKDKMSLIVGETSTWVQLDKQLIRFLYEQDTETSMHLLCDYILSKMSLCYLKINLNNS